MNADARLPFVPSPPAVFDLLADSNPGLLPRVLQALARRSVVPQRLAAERAETGLRVRIVLSGVSPGMLSLIEGNLRQVVGVQQLSCCAMHASGGLAHAR